MLPQKRNRPGLTNGRILAILSLVIVYLVSNQIRYSRAVENGLKPSETKKQIVVIQKGQTAKDVGKMLEEKDIIKNGNHLRKFLKKQDLSEKILAGRFELAPSMPIRQIASIITDPSQAKNSITIPEGFSIRQIDERLAELEIAKQGEFIDAVKKFSNASRYPWLPKREIMATPLPLEGFLFPDTYNIDPSHFSAKNLIALMLENFKRHLPENIETLLHEKNITLFELITVASMLEKEVRHEDDLKIVSGIIWKRVRSGWFLNIDASVLYGLDKKTVTGDDLKRDTPYNTYTRKNLPLGPIGNPGQKTIEAALSPQKSPYWFYLTNPKNGKAVYAVTNDGQNRNRGIYLR